MAEGQLVKWLVKEGDKVHRGDVVAVVETHKGAIDLEVFQDGRILELLHQPVATLPVGTVLARMESDQPKKSVDVPPPGISAPSPVRGESTPAPPPVDASRSTPRVIATPLARRLARQAGINLAEVHGSGPKGEVLQRDLADTEGTRQPVEKSMMEADPMRAAIATAMTRSNREIPHYYLSLELNLDPCLTWMEQRNAEREPEQRLLLPALLMRASALALVDFPQMNGHLLPQGYQPSNQVNVGHVISLRQGGVVVPAIRGVESLSLDQVMETLRDQVQRARGGHLRSSELNCATVTITSLGDRGCDSVFGVIYPPQVALLGFGRVRQQPVLQENQWRPGRILTATLSADHRVSDGMSGARLLAALADRLLKPEEL